MSIGRAISKIVSYVRFEVASRKGFQAFASFTTLEARHVSPEFWPRAIIGCKNLDVALETALSQNLERTFLALNFNQKSNVVIELA